MKNAIWVVRLLVVLASTQVSLGGPLNLTPRYPDITATNVKFTYDGSQFFSNPAATLAMSLDVNGGGEDYLISSGKYLLNALIDSSGSLISGSLKISGILLESPSLTPVTANIDQLLGTLTEFGYRRVDTNGAVFEFRFRVDGGYLRTSRLFDSNGGEIIISAPASTTSGQFPAGEFGAGFTLKNAKVDTFIPTPMALPGGITLLAGTILIGSLRRRAVRVAAQHFVSAGVE